MTLELEECIKDAAEDSMKEYMQSEEYVHQKHIYMELLKVLLYEEG